MDEKRQFKGRRRSPNYPPWIVDAARAVYLDGAIPSRIAEEMRKAFPAERRTPSERTLRGWAERWQPDPSGLWAFDNPATDPEIVLPLLADLVEATKGRVRSLTNAEAAVLTRLGRAVPDMPVVGMYGWSRAFIAARDHEPTESLLHYLAFTPWRDRGERYLAAFGRGWIEELRNLSPDDVEWLPPTPWIRRGSIKGRLASEADKPEGTPR